MRDTIPDSKPQALNIYWYKTLTCFGPLAAHTQVLSVPSSLALMILDLSNATASTMPSWPRRVIVRSPVVRSVTVMVPSVLPDTTFGGEATHARGDDDEKACFEGRSKKSGACVMCEFDAR